VIKQFEKMLVCLEGSSYGIPRYRIKQGERVMKIHRFGTRVAVIFKAQ